MLAVSDVRVARDQTSIELEIRFSKTDQIGNSSCVKIGVGEWGFRGCLAHLALICSDMTGYTCQMKATWRSAQTCRAR